MSSLNPNKALIFRIVHRANIPWILTHGLHSPSSPIQAPDYRTIGNPELISKRQRRQVPVTPFGVLSDYVPFYFTPFSPMMYNIRTGYGGIAQLDNADIVIFVASLFRLQELGLPFVFTDRHAYLARASFFNDLKELCSLDWNIWQVRDFRRDPEDPEKIERYQAEALVHEAVPVEAMLGLVCQNRTLEGDLRAAVAARALDLAVHARPRWYFP